MGKLILGSFIALIVIAMIIIFQRYDAVIQTDTYYKNKALHSKKRIDTIFLGYSFTMDSAGFRRHTEQLLKSGKLKLKNGKLIYVFPIPEDEKYITKGDIPFEITDVNFFKNKLCRISLESHSLDYTLNRLVSLHIASKLYGSNSRYTGYFDSYEKKDKNTGDKINYYLNKNLIIKIVPTSYGVDWSYMDYPNYVKYVEYQHTLEKEKPAKQTSNDM